DIDERRRRLWRNAQMRNQAARCATVRGDDAIARQRTVPGSHARRHYGVAFATWREEAPFILLAPHDPLWIALAQLRDGEAFPLAEGNFRKLRGDHVARRIEA